VNGSVTAAVQGRALLRGGVTHRPLALRNILNLLRSPGRVL
jgi:hypothetical protein